MRIKLHIVCTLSVSAAYCLLRGVNRSPEACGKSWREPCVGSCPNSEQKRQPRPTAKKGGRKEGGGGGRPRGRWPQAHAPLQFHVYPLHDQPVSMTRSWGSGSQTREQTHTEGHRGQWPPRPPLVHRGPLSPLLKLYEIKICHKVLILLEKTPSCHQLENHCRKYPNPHCL